MMSDLPMSIFYYLIFYSVSMSNTEKYPICVIMNSFYDDVLNDIEFITSSSYAGNIKFTPFFHSSFIFSISSISLHINS